MWAYEKVRTPSPASTVHSTRTPAATVAATGAPSRSKWIKTKLSLRGAPLLEPWVLPHAQRSLPVDRVLERGYDQPKAKAPTHSCVWLSRCDGGFSSSCVRLGVPVRRCFPLLELA